MKHENDLERLTKLGSSFLKIERFNDVIGNPDNYESVYNQLLRVQEELEESLDAFSVAQYPFEIIDVDNKELLDGVVDTLVTSLGLIKKAESLGFDVFGALEAVCINNESKYCQSEAHADETVEYYAEQGVATYKQFSDKAFVWVVKRTSDNKLMKCIGYESVQLGEFLPK